MNKSTFILIVISLLTSAWSLVKYGRSAERAENAEIVVALQKDLMALGQVIQAQAEVAANATKEKIALDARRIERIKSISLRNRTEVFRLNKLIKKAGEENAKLAQQNYYTVVSVNDVNRVWNEARGSRQLPETNAASVLQGELSAITSTGIATTIKHCIGRYNACAIKYNSMWRECELLLGH